jgi:hypothetical protein
MTYKELQTLGALAGWPKCESSRGILENRPCSCNRFFDPDWPNEYFEWGSFCPVPVDEFNPDNGVSCCDISDDKWMRLVEEHLEKHGVEL